MVAKLLLQTIPLGKKDPAWMADYKAGEFRQGSKTMPYRLYAPEGGVEEGKLYPIVLWLHGVKGRGDDNAKQISAGNSYGPAFFSSPTVQENFPAFILVPQCPLGKFWINFANNRIRRPLKFVMGILDHFLAELPVDATRVYIGGQSMGGFATWAALAEYPERFAAGIPVSGGGSVRKAKKSIQAPVWAFHGAVDPIVGVGRSREMVETLKKNNKTANYTEFPSWRHDIWPQVFEEPNLAEWLFANERKPAKKRK
jgi:predicted peptidase